ncbi:Reverse transcriptase zinc-binding domain [Macleaya cordata]|uniref:Reverse transcriptase zinc-binding domain n=1 Tax=Macleaya cordata TaxID=56857 RepID=A0A200QPI5_MACCD|nr:Reverse transcriptase zinc-binding domain [Macleaya cordata]
MTFPKLYKLSKKKNASISDVQQMENEVLVWNLDFKRTLKPDEQSEWNAMQILLGDPTPLNQDQDDVFRCKFSNATNFSVKECYEHSCMEDGDKFPVKMLWRKGVPSKVSFMIWSVFQNAIPTMDNLRRRGMVVRNRCWLCKQQEETVSHLFIHCSMARSIWQYFLRPFKVEWVTTTSIMDHFFWWKMKFGRNRGRKIWELLPYAICWTIWLERNVRAFENQENHVQEIVIKVKVLLFLWGSLDKIFSNCSFNDLMNNWEIVVNL